MTQSKSNNSKKSPRVLPYKSKKKLRTNWIFETFCLPNPKTGEMIKTEALIEHDFVLKAFFTPSILSIKTDIDSINSASQQRRYTPDILTYQEGAGFKYIDCKDVKSMRKQKNIDKFKALFKEFSDAGSCLEVVTEDKIRIGYLIPNLKKLYMYLSMPEPDKSTISFIVGIVDTHFKITFAELKTRVAGKNIGVRSIWYCLAHQIIQTNLEKYITDKSVLWSESSYAVSGE